MIDVGSLLRRGFGWHLVSVVEHDAHAPNTTGTGRILLIDDEAALRNNVARALQGAGHTVVAAEDGAEGLRQLDAGAFDAVLTDIRMPKMTGVELLRAIRLRDADLPVVFLTGSPAIETATEAVALGALAYLVKPVELDVIRSTMARAVTLGRMAKTKRAALRELGGNSQGPGDRAGLEVSFARALPRLWSAFQPLVKVDGTLFGHEALMRSSDPELPNPLAVLNAAEKLDRLNELGRAMRARAAAPVALDPSCGELFVNLHPRDLFDPELLDPASPLMAIAPRVVLEITERASLDDLGDVKARATALRARGFRLAIDDLGAGYAGLTAFARLEPEVVKLDMSLIRDVDTSATKQKLVSAMTRLCRDLGILTVAEGIETRAELDAVIALGCEVVQGYLVAKPGPAFPSVSWPIAATPRTPPLAHMP